MDFYDGYYMKDYEQASRKGDRDKFVSICEGKYPSVGKDRLVLIN